MKILLINKYWRPFGGVETHAIGIQQVFEELGHEVVPFSMQDARNFETPYAHHFVSQVEMREGPPMARLRAAGRAIFGIETVSKLRALLDEVQVDVAHVLHAYHHLGTTFLPLLRRHKIPVVLSVHDYKIGCPNYRLYSEAAGQICTICMDKPHAWAWAPMARRCWDSSPLAGAILGAEAVVSRGIGTYRRYTDAVVVLNELQRRAAEAAGIPRARVHRVPNFCEVGPAPARQRQDHVLYVGRLVPEKGVDVLIQACALAGLPLRVVGDGRTRNGLEALAREVGARVTFAGFKTGQELRDELESAAVLAVPSLWHDVWPTVVLEAWDANLAVVGSDLGGITEQLGEGRGFLCPPGDVETWARTLSGLVTNGRKRCDEAARAARDYALRELSQERWVDRMRTVYAEVGATL